VADAVRQTAETFGGIDVCVNNASAISLAPIEGTEPKRYDLMQSINSRGTFLAIRACAPHLRRGRNPHILTLSPPITLEPKWLGAHAPYTLSKFGMSLLTLGAARSCARRASPPTASGLAR
jgi:citronellol/citronellal dehydrogenase